MAFAAAAIGVGTAASLTSCGSFEGILFWGPSEHEALYKALWNEFVEANPEYADIEFQYGNKGDAGAYDGLAVDVQSGASIYTFANDQLANIVRIGAAAALTDADAKWIEENHTLIRKLQMMQVKSMANTMAIQFQLITVMFSAITKMLLSEHLFGMKKQTILKQVTHSEIYLLL